MSHQKPKPYGLAALLVLLVALVCLSAATTAQPAQQSPSVSQSLNDEQPPPDDDLEAVQSDEDSGAAAPIPDEPDEPDSQPSEPTSQTPATQPATQQAPAEPQPKPSVPATPAAPAPQPQTQTPAPKAPKAATTVPAGPAGPPSFPTIKIRVFKCYRTASLAQCDLHVSHSSVCQLAWPGGNKPVPIPREPDDNSKLIHPTLENLSPQGGDVTAICDGIEPNPASERAVWKIGPAEVITTKIKVKTKPKKQGRTVKVSRPKTVQVAVPIAPADVASTFRAFCYMDPRKGWAYTQGPIAGANYAYYPPFWNPDGYGPHCDFGRLHKGQWMAYRCFLFIGCADPTKGKVRLKKP